MSEDNFQQIYYDTFKVHYYVVFARDKKTHQIKKLTYNFVPSLVLLKNDFNRFIKKASWEIIKQVKFNSLKEANLCTTV